jgi:hypothetical protein
MGFVLLLIIDYFIILHQRRFDRLHYIGYHLQVFNAGESQAVAISIVSVSSATCDVEVLQTETTAHHFNKRCTRIISTAVLLPGFPK